MARRKAKPMDRLTIVSIAAQKEGLSYGKYMVKHGYAPPCLNNLPEEIIPPVKKATIPEYLKDIEQDFKARELRKCRYCGKKFEPESGNQFYCSQECYRENARARERKKSLVGKVQRYCVICNTPLPLSVSVTRKTCSEECRAEYKRICDKERNRKAWQKKKQAAEEGA